MWMAALNGFYRTKGEGRIPGNATDPTGPAIDRSDHFFAEQQAGGGGLPPIPLYDRLPRPIPELIGPAHFRNDRTDHPALPEPPVEAHVETLEEKRSPRPILKSIGPIIFFCGAQSGGRRVTEFFKGGGSSHLFSPEIPGPVLTGPAFSQQRKEQGLRHDRQFQIVEIHALVGSVDP